MLCFLQKLAARVIAVFSPQAGVKSVSIDTLSRIPEEVSVQCVYVCMCVCAGGVRWCEVV